MRIAPFASAITSLTESMISSRHDGKFVGKPDAIRSTIVHARRCNINFAMIDIWWLFLEGNATRPAVRESRKGEMEGDHSPLTQFALGSTVNGENWGINDADIRTYEIANKLPRTPQSRRKNARERTNPLFFLLLLSMMLYYFFSFFLVAF